MITKVRSSILLPVILLLGTIAFIHLDFLPSYTRLAISFLIMPIIFFIFRKEEKINEKKYLVVILFSVLVSIAYDTIAQDVWLWGFPRESVSLWILNIPIEEYLFGFWFPTLVIGIYTSLAKSKKKKLARNYFPRIKESILFGIIFSIQLVIWSFLMANPVSYIGWVLFFAAAPAIFYIWRKREKIDERRLFITTLIMMAVVVIIDLIFIPANTWYYNELAILGYLGIIPIDDFLFTLFNTIFVIGFYTSLPDKKMITAKM